MWSSKDIDIASILKIQSYKDIDVTRILKIWSSKDIDACISSDSNSNFTCIPTHNLWLAIKEVYGYQDRISI